MRIDCHVPPSPLDKGTTLGFNTAAYARLFALTPCPSPTAWERRAVGARCAFSSPSPTLWERGLGGEGGEKATPYSPPELRRCTLAKSGLGGEGNKAQPTRRTNLSRMLIAILIACFLLVLGFTQSNDYTLDTGDVLSVTVLRHGQFSGEFTVPPSGRVVFPGVGELTVRGLTLSQLSEILRERLSKRLRNPEVFVSLKQARPLQVFVEGKVNSPGAYSIRPGWRLFEAIAAAGGLSVPPERAAAFHIRGDQITRINLARLYHDGDLSVDIPLQPGDKINIQEEPTIRVSIIGEVERTGSASFRVGTGVLDALAQAGGVKGSAALKRAYIDRKGQIIPLDLYRALTLGELDQNRIELQDGDVIVVPRHEQRYTVAGQVSSPGLYSLPEGRPLLLSEALARAGGVTARARTSKVFILRMEGDEIRRLEFSYLDFLRRGDPKQNPAIQDGDVILLTEANRFDWSTALSALSIVSIANQLGLVR